jgi:hypothetical protein
VRPPLKSFIPSHVLEGFLLEEELSVIFFLFISLTIKKKELQEKYGGAPWFDFLEVFTTGKGPKIGYCIEVLLIFVDQCFAPLEKRLSDILIHFKGRECVG